MAKDHKLVEMHFGPDKIEEGIEALLSKDKQIHSSEDEHEVEIQPYKLECEDMGDE